MKILISLLSGVICVLLVYVISVRLFPNTFPSLAWTISSQLPLWSTPMSAVSSGEIQELREEIRLLREQQILLAKTLSGVQEAALQWGLPSVPDISARFLSRLLPTVNLKKVENTGVFDTVEFTGSLFQTYDATELGMRVYVFGSAYPIVQNALLQTGLYDLNDQDMFFDRTTYINQKENPDLKVRFLTSVETQTIGIEVPRTLYPKIKSLLLRP